MIFPVLKLGGTEASISYVIIDWSYSYPLLHFACGVLCGHFFWRVGNVKGTESWGQDD